MNDLKILYEDNHIIVVIKPVNILSQADNTKDMDMLTIIKKYLKEKYQKPGNVYLGLVHRLDRPVGGVMVFAKTSKAAARLNKQILDKDFQKSYYAIVEGYLTEKEGTLIDYLEKLPNKKVIVNKESGKESILKYKVINEKDNYSLLDINLLTGRYHQIRVQFSIRNHPLYADSLYGKKENDTIALYAYKLSFLHPITNERLTFTNKPSGNIWEKYLT